jgi:hypothetical protein
MDGVSIDPVTALVAVGFAGLLLGWLWIIRIGREPGEN